MGFVSLSKECVDCHHYIVEFLYCCLCSPQHLYFSKYNFVFLSTTKDIVSWILFMFDLWDKHLLDFLYHGKLISPSIMAGSFGVYIILGQTMVFQDLECIVLGSLFFKFPLRNQRYFDEFFFVYISFFSLLTFNILSLFYNLRYFVYFFYLYGCVFPYLGEVSFQDFVEDLIYMVSHNSCMFLYHVLIFFIFLIILSRSPILSLSPDILSSE